MKVKFSKAFWREAYVIIIVALALLVNVINWLLIGWKARWQFDVMPLHYNIYFGIDWFGPAVGLYLYPGLALLIFLFNLILSWWLFSRQRFISYLLLSLPLLFNIFFLAASSLVVLSNIS